MRKLALTLAFLLILPLAVWAGFGKFSPSGSSAGGTGFPLTGNVSAAGFNISSVGALSAKSTNNNVQYADQFTGSTADVKIAAAMAAACPQTGPNQTPVTNGIVDARGLTGSQSIATTITMRPNCTLTLGVGTYTFATGAQLLYDSGDAILGANRGLGYTNQRGTQFQQTAGDSGTAIAYVNGTGGNGAYNVDLEDFSMYDGSHTAGSVAISLVHTLYSRIRNVVINGNFDVGMKLGFTGGCDCYNHVYDSQIAGASYGLYILAGQYANQNQFYGTNFSSPGVAAYLGGDNNTLYSPDFESSGVAEEFAGGVGSGADTTYNPYNESNTTDVQFDSGAVGNMVWGGYASPNKIVDNSGSSGANIVFTTGDSPTAGGTSPSIWATSDLRLGGNLVNAGNLGLDLDAPTGGPDNGATLNFSANEQTVYGRTGHGPLVVGQLTANGASFNSIATAALPNPPAPTCVYTGAAGSTTYTFYNTCKTSKAKISLVSPACTVNNAAATLDASDYVNVTANCGNGYNTADLLENGTSGTVLVTSTQLSPNNIAFKVSGQALSSYTPPTRNTTADVTVAGLFTEGCAGTVTLSAGAATVTNACISGSRPVICTDQTGVNAVKCAPSSGSISVAGTSTDVISWAQL